MDRSDLHRLWTRVLQRLEGQVPASQLDAYLKTAQLEEGTEAGDLDLHLPDRFARDAIEKHRLEGKIRDALEAEGDSRPVRFLIRARPRRRRADVDPDQGTLRFEGSSEPAAPAAKEGAGARTRGRGAPPVLPNLNPKYTMDHFVVGDGNRLAHAICEAVAGSPGKVYNPVFVYGGVGLGKTHLMQAVGHLILERQPRARLRYVPSELFSNDYITSVKEGKTSEFREKHRQLDLLMIDDVQFFGGKEGLQEEFFHTFNELYQSGKQVMLTSDRSPKQLENLQERLVSRFESGVVADIKPPNVETRLAILMRLCDDAGLEARPGTLEVLAERIRSNIRLLEGAFNKVTALCSLGGGAITREIVEEVVGEYATDQGGPRMVTIPLIQEMVAEYYHLSVDDLCSRRRTKAIVLPRQLAMFLAHEMTEETLEAIAKAFGKKDHTTVIHACDKIRKLVGRDGDVDAALRTLRGRIRDVLEE